MTDTKTQPTLGTVLNNERIVKAKKAAVELHSVSVILNRYANEKEFRHSREQRFSEASGGTI